MILCATWLALIGAADPAATSSGAGASVQAGLDAPTSTNVSASPTGTEAAVETDAEVGLDAQASTIVSASPTGDAAKSSETTSEGIRGIPVSASALVGTGVSVAPGPERSLAVRSPVLLTVDAGFFHPELRWLEFSPAALIELERGVMFGLGFRLRAFIPLRYVRPYGLAGVQVFLAPSKLYGTRFAAGVAVQLHRNLAVAAEFGPVVFFAGDDLATGGSVTKIDGSAGLRASF